MEALSLKLTGISVMAWSGGIVVRLDLGKEKVRWVRELRTDVEHRWDTMAPWCSAPMLIRNM